MDNELSKNTEISENVKKGKAKKKEKADAAKPYYCNRELSWLKFNERVLDEAMDKNVPLCERLSFVSIFQSNLDEFFMVRVGTLTDQMLFSDSNRDNKTGMTASEQLSSIFSATRELSRKKDRAYLNLMSEISEYGIELISFNDIEFADAVYLENYFRESIMPLLSPQVIGKKQPFPFLRNKEIYAVALLRTRSNEKLGIVPCSNGVFERMVAIPSDRNKYMLVEELILHFMPQIFAKYTIESKSLIRIIRNADIDVDTAFYDEDLDYRNTMEKLIRERRKLCPVKMEYSRVLDEKVIVSLCKELKLKKEQIYYSEAPLSMSFVSTIQDKLRNQKDLFYIRRVPQNSRYIESSIPIMEQIERKDILLSYPFESMQPFIRLLNEAGENDNVVSIKMTLYRVAKNSQIVEALINAAENGKEVVVLVELRARFDEENNIEGSRRLEDAGCRIIYGIDYIKVHSKLCLITYREDSVVKHITQIGTGNYNEKTAKLYTDLSLMTANESIAQEASEIFNRLCLAQVMEETHHLLVAPKCLQNKVIGFIDEEIRHADNGEEAYIGVKINSLTDKAIIDKLVEASQHGVRIDLVVRGICCLIPGIDGFTENIHVISIVGRYLEHSRIYIFGTEERDNIFISSADFMTRNTIKRVEVATPVYDKELKDRIRNMFGIMLRDTAKGRQLCSDGNYYRREKQQEEHEEIDSQSYFSNEAYLAASKNIT
ncbi:MAG: polyphosphate kinase 1 [Lachnospira sp.]|nr:polyphosphate kinase 1 [Lachnospira sp.]